MLHHIISKITIHVKYFSKSRGGWKFPCMTNLFLQLCIGNFPNTLGHRTIMDEGDFLCHPFLNMAIYRIVTRIDFSTHEPFGKRLVRIVQDFVPFLWPGCDVPNVSPERLGRFDGFPVGIIVFVVLIWSTSVDFVVCEKNGKILSQNDVV